MAGDCNDEPEEEENIFEEDIQNESYMEPPFDENVLTPEQRVELEKLYKENPTMTRSVLAAMIRVNLVSHRASLEGRELTFSEIMVAHALEEVIYWVPPCQLEGICDSTFEFHDIEDSLMPCVEDVASSLQTPILIDECYDLICETERLDTLRVEKLTKDYHETCFDISYLSVLSVHDLEFKFSMLEESSSLLVNHCLGDVINVDKLLDELEDPEIKINSGNENIVFYMIDGDEVNYWVKNSFEPEVDFILPSNAFDSHEHLTKKDFMIYATSVVKFLDESSIILPWMRLLAHFVRLISRRRTKGALAQPFDSQD